jgi:hypothetical protein
MIERISQSGIDLTGIHLILTLFGGLLAVYVMQLTHYEAEDFVDPWIVRTMRRLSLALISASMFWSAWYSMTHQWAPWPPEVILIFAINLGLVIRMVAIWARIKRTGHRCWDRPGDIRKALIREAIRKNSDKSVPIL